MARFDRNADEPKFSPDKRYFAIVTSRGVLNSDEIESTLWLFKSDSLKAVFRDSSPGIRSVPKVLARLTVSPRLVYSDSFEPLITELRWRPDSRTIVFLGLNSRGKRQLQEADVKFGTVRVLTPADRDVTRFEFVGSDVVYVAVPTSKTRMAGEPINSDARDVTGVSSTSILFPETTDLQERGELWILRDGKSRRIKDSATGRPIQLPNLTPHVGVLSVSSVRRTVVVLMSSIDIPPTWGSYKPVFDYLKIRPSDAHTDLWPTQYAEISLDSGHVKVLLDAPNGWALGSADRNQAIWSSDAKKLLLTNTYLPLEATNDAEKSKRLGYCMAALVELASGNSSCVAFSSYDRAKRHLIAASFGDSDKEVVLRFWNVSNPTTEERYRETNGIWEFVDRSLSPDRDLPNPLGDRSAQAAFSLQIEQDLNTPPALWAKDLETRQSKKIWDPNPQLEAFDLGQASELHWTDATGYDWVGGLVKPPNYVAGRRYPLVIQTHGFQTGEFITEGPYSTAFAARPLASAGIMVLQMPTRHDRLVTDEEAALQIEGFRSAIERLVADGLVDAKKVGIIGFSRTCYYVESALIENPERFAAATIADGVDESYMQYLLFGVGQTHEESEQIYGGTPFGDSLSRWVRKAPGFHLDRIQTPLRIEAITPASILEEWEIYASLAKQGKRVDLVYLPNGQHILQRPLERMASQQGNVDWFRFWLKGEEDADPNKSKQYDLWKRLRNQPSRGK